MYMQGDAYKSIDLKEHVSTSWARNELQSTIYQVEVMPSKIPEKHKKPK